MFFCKGGYLFSDSINITFARSSALILTVDSEYELCGMTNAWLYLDANLIFFAQFPGFSLSFFRL